MLKRVTVLMILLLSLCSNTFSQNIPYGIQDIDGNEISISRVVPAPNGFSSFPSFSVRQLTFLFTNSGVKTGYDLQSNGVPRQLWQDPLRPQNVHAVYMTSQQAAGWTDRGGNYFFSNDTGATWQNFGQVPNGIRAGFPTIDGLSNGAAVTSVHTAGISGGAVRSLLYIDEGPGAGNFTEKNPGLPTGDNPPIWPRIQADAMDRIALVASSSATAPLDISYHTSYNGTTFTPWVEFGHSTAEIYSMAKNTAGNKIGLAYIGKNTEDEVGDIFYKESEDGGANWTQPFKVWNLDWTGDSTGGLRGINLAFLGDDPYITWENSKAASVTSYYPGLASSIMLWSPNLAGGLGTDGNSKILVDTSNFEEYSNYGVADVFVPVCRPSIGKAANDSALFIAFSAASENDFAAVDTVTPYYNIWFMYSTDKGASWTDPERINPVTTSNHKDWRYVNISPWNYVDSLTGMCTVQMVAQVDSIPGSTSQTGIPGWPAAVSAECIFIRTQVKVPVTVGVNDPIVSSFKYELEQNYPNPFNPSTKIKFSVAERSNVTLKVFDVLGREVAVLLNETKEAGSHQVDFNASKLSSGLYVYQLTAGNNTFSKKMMFLK